MRMEGNNAEQELAATGIDWRCGLGDSARENRSQDRVPLATMEMWGKGGHRNGDGRGTLVFFYPFNIFQYQENEPRENHWRHNQEAGNVDLRTIKISL